MSHAAIFSPTTTAFSRSSPAVYAVAGTAACTSPISRDQAETVGTAAVSRCTTAYMGSNMAIASGSADARLYFSARPSDAPITDGGSISP